MLRPMPSPNIFALATTLKISCQSHRRHAVVVSSVRGYNIGENDAPEGPNEGADSAGSTQLRTSVAPQKVKAQRSTKRHFRQRNTQRENNKSIQQKEQTLSLADFIHRSKVREQYRNFVRIAHFLDEKRGNALHAEPLKLASGPKECGAALMEVRSSFKMGMSRATDSISRKMAYSEGERRLRELKPLIGFVAERKGQRVDQGSQHNYDADSWINIKDEEDPRGRVGLEWPWERGNGS